ncbi:MAG TPA: RNA-binding S4 domain-containing protein [Pseudogracilibacillus sp.]|nr:RNA-binding S4 domain-containing protein [Pseudogracilibacillus sp.]
MRLDKFLKVSRLIRRRPLAKEVAEDGRIKINGQVAKPATKVEVGDEIEITFGQKIVTVEVVKLQEHVRKAEATSLYEVVNEERREIFEE